MHSKEEEIKLVEMAERMLGAMERGGLLAEGDVAENLTKETKEKLKKMFTPSNPNEEITTLDQSTDRPEWTAAKAEAEPEAVQTRQNIPSERPMKENHKEEDKRTQRSQRRRKREPAGRNLRRSKAEVRGTWTTVAWEATKQCIRNMLYVWGIFCLLAPLGPFVLLLVILLHGSF